MRRAVLEEGVSDSAVQSSLLICCHKGRWKLARTKVTATSRAIRFRPIHLLLSKSGGLRCASDSCTGNRSSRMQLHRKQWRGLCRVAQARRRVSLSQPGVLAFVFGFRTARVLGRKSSGMRPTEQNCPFSEPIRHCAALWDPQSSSSRHRR